MFRSAPVRLRDALKMIGIAILIVELILPALLLAVWAAVTYTPTLTDSFGYFWHTGAFIFNLFIFAFVTTLLIVPVAVALLMAGIGGWAVAFVLGGIVSHAAFLVLSGLKEAAYDFGFVAMTSLPGVGFAGALWFCAQLARPKQNL
ncbi:hypothetical protein [Yoonia sp. I 8.24]|uniref:hypothetical protein n=1 Tax=Yoonia sp. I 8.24 TaxID=1537229 RepID=UPI001EE12324|nr:hypothetical protein [Yoonia sp. I 8.24]MCG3267968.1 hypothetical protein [Yoonia sp. I 8.24]